MANVEKKRIKMQVRIKELETLLTTSLHRKSSVVEIDVGKIQRQIAELKNSLGKIS